MAELKKEAPFAYKSITPVVTTLAESGIATPVVEIEPINHDAEGSLTVSATPTSPTATCVP